MATVQPRVLVEGMRTKDSQIIAPSRRFGHPDCPEFSETAIKSAILAIYFVASPDGINATRE